MAIAGGIQAGQAERYGLTLKVNFALMSVRYAAKLTYPEMAHVAGLTNSAATASCLRAVAKLDSILRSDGYSTSDFF